MEKKVTIDNLLEVATAVNDVLKTKASTSAVTTATNDLQTQIDAMQGQTRRFFVDFDVEFSTDTPTKTQTDAWLASCTPSLLPNVGDAFKNSNTTQSTYNHLFVYYVDPLDTDELILSDDGVDTVSTASASSLGVVRGAGDIEVDLNGDMFVKDEAIAGQVDKVTASYKVYGTDDEGKQVTYNVDDFGKVDTVNGISPDTSKNVQTDYVYATETEFEAAKANIPIGATVIKLYEYPESYAGFMAVPDYSRLEAITGLNDIGKTWVANRDGFVRLTISNQVISNAIFNINGTQVLNIVGTNDWEREETFCPIHKGDILSISGIAAHPTHDGYYVAYDAYFYPVRYVVTPNAASVIGKLTPAVAKFIGQPDYKNRESTNRITVSNGTWKVDRDGYVTVGVSTTAAAVEWLTLYINNVLVYRDVSRNAVSPDTIQTVVPVSKDDVITLGAQPEAGMFCYFIPPLTPPSLFVEGADLQSSTATGKVKIDPETKTMSVSGEIDTTGTYSINRPDLWAANVEINFGSGLYGRRATGTFTETTSGTINEIVLTPYTVVSLLNSGGWWNFGEGTRCMVNAPMGNSSAITYWSNLFIHTTEKTIKFRSVSGNNRTATTTYDIWITYTK
jgi:hypothetical protein